MNRRTAWTALLVLGLLLIVAGLEFAFRPAAWHGSVISPPAPAAEIHLTDQAGQPFALSSLRGKVVLLYFGYTNCPDECPLTMAHVKLAVDGLGSRAQGVRVIMITTDPARDSAPVLRDWLAKFNPDFVGLSGTPAQLAATWKDYGVTVEDGGETHSYFIYVIDQAGQLRETFLPESLPADETSDLALLLAGH